MQGYNSATDDYINKSIFKDKKLNYLWSKAETSGFTHEELVALREEFTHHQEKIDQYYDLFDEKTGKDDGFKSMFSVLTLQLCFFFFNLHNSFKPGQKFIFY